MNSTTSLHDLTPEQMELANAKQNLERTLGEVANRVDSVFENLENLNGKPFVDFIHSQLQAQKPMEDYLSAVGSYLTAYKYTRERLISFADKDDIFFIPQLINPIRIKLEKIVSLLEKEKKNILHYPYKIPADVLEDVMSNYMFFGSYQYKLEKIYHEYEDLYDSIYHCEDTEYEKRFDHEFKTIIGERFCTNNIHNLVLSIFDYPIHTIEHQQHTSGIKIDSKRVIISLGEQISKEKIQKLQESIFKHIQKIIPHLTLEEFTNQTELSKRIQQNRMLHHDVNSIITGYYQLQQLENIKKSIYESITPGPKECTSFNDIDKKMLEEIYARAYEQEKSIVPKHNEFALLFLIGMTRDRPTYLDRKLAACHQHLSSALTGVKLGLRTLQRNLRKYIEKLSSDVQTWKDVVARIIGYLTPYNLFFSID